MTKIITIFDTETTGFPSNGGLDAQPHMVQLAAIQFCGDRPVAHVSAVINNGVEVPERAAEIHGITKDFAQKVGVRPMQAISPFLRMLENSEELVAYNTGFDLKIAAAALERFCPNETPILKRGLQISCCMNSAIEVVKKPGRYSGYAWPKQIETYKHLFGQNAEFNAHDAMDDVRACAKIYFRLKADGVKILGPVRK